MANGTVVLKLKLAAGYNFHLLGRRGRGIHPN
jgi:hypothetical protein